ncbi:hypothetical protein [Acidocella aromatica]|uniref:Putative membrane protein n=1 Tax=Acidocella aromatica TaxID=1303579 RepID=A0A840VC92_9PROT|nr:hypothetical protein [Acidocella aromatica]MBB5372467.1 putative membrane protein [Acidocella aromatica]
MQSTVVYLSGVFTAIITSFLVVYVGRLLNTDIFSYMLWLVVPAGAIGTGIASASGYFFAAYYFNRMPTKALFFLMFLASSVAPFLIYFIQYETMALDDGTPVNQVCGFFHFMNVMITTASYSIGRYGNGPSTGAVGSFGYWIAADQFIGFLLAGIVLFLLLLNVPSCSNCKKYMRTLGSRSKSFDNVETFAAYYDNIFKIPVYSPDFTNAIAMDIRRDNAKKPQAGNILLRENLITCEECGSQILENVVSIFNGKQWNDADKLKRRVEIPFDVKLRPIFSKGQRKAETQSNDQAAISS